MIERQSRIRLWCGIFVLALIAGFTAVWIFFHEPIGDDVLCYFQGALTDYLPEFETKLGPRITTFSQVFRELKFTYLYWSGRMPGYALGLVGRLLPKSGQAILTALLYTCNVFLTLRIVHRDSRKALSSPVSAMILFTSLYWFRIGAFYTYMWTMTSIYALATCLCLLYINLAVVDEQQGRKRNLFIISIVGFLAGFSHEVISLCTIAVVGTFWLISVIRKEQKWYTLFRHTGLGIGYLFCFFAPGNFYRMHQPHDIIETGYLYRLYRSFNTHLSILFGSQSGGTAMIAARVLAVLAVFVFILIVIKKDTTKLLSLLEENSGFLAGGAVSILAWAMTPRVPSYGLDLWIVLCYIVLFKIVNLLPNIIPSLRPIGKKLALQMVCVFLLVICFAASSWKELADSATVFSKRQQLAADAVSRGAAEVVVPAYPDSLSPQRFYMGYINGQNQYDTCYYQMFYGTLLIIENP